ncbi:MAG: hypothetical protein KF812_11705 [Fimbriimonadaceae bacterium]|nr:hypothetical protein [Fimbriimonadaceae bacterium]
MGKSSAHEILGVSIGSIALPAIPVVYMLASKWALMNSRMGETLMVFLPYFAMVAVSATVVFRLNWRRLWLYPMVLAPMFVSVAFFGRPQDRPTILLSTCLQAVAYIGICELFVALSKQHFESKAARKLKREMSDPKPRRIDL